MTPKKGKKDKNAEYCQKYRQKVKLRRLRSRNFDKKYRKKEAMRKAAYRAKRKQQQSLSIQASSDIPISRNDFRKRKGLQRRRQNIKRLK